MLKEVTLANRTGPKSSLFDPASSRISCYHNAFPTSNVLVAPLGKTGFGTEILPLALRTPPERPILFVSLVQVQGACRLTH